MEYAMPPRNFFISWGVVAVTSAPKPALATLMKYWSFIRPTSISVGLPVHASSSALIKSFASMPAPFAKSLAVPSGRMPSDVFGRRLGLTPQGGARAAGPLKHHDDL